MPDTAIPTNQPTRAATHAAASAPARAIPTTLDTVLATAVVGLEQLKNTERNASFPLKVRKACLNAQTALSRLAQEILDERDARIAWGTSEASGSREAINTEST